MEGEVVNSMEWLTTALETIGTLITQSISIITGNPILAVFLGAGLLAVGFRVFKKARKTA